MFPGIITVVHGTYRLDPGAALLREKTCAPPSTLFLFISNILFHHFLSLLFFRHSCAIQPRYLQHLILRLTADSNGICATLMYCVARDIELLIGIPGIYGKLRSECVFWSSEGRSRSNGLALSFFVPCTIPGYLRYGPVRRKVQRYLGIDDNCKLRR